MYVNVTLTSQVLVKPSNMTLSHGEICITSVVSSVATRRMMPPVLQTQRFKKVTTHQMRILMGGEVPRLPVNMHCETQYLYENQL